MTSRADIVREMDRIKNNRSKFIQTAARAELKRRHRELLERPLQQPHPESAELEEACFEDWVASLADEDGDDLVDCRLGEKVKLVEGQG